MRNPVYILLVVVASSLLLTNCGGDRAAERQLREADAVMNSVPDSALSILTSMETGGLSEEQRVRHGLMLTKASRKNYTPLTEDSIIKASVSYYLGSGDSLEVQSLYYLGEIKSHAGILDTALIVLSESYEKSTTCGDALYAGMSAREIASIYTRIYNPDQQLKWAQIAKQRFREADRPLHAAWMDIMILISQSIILRLS